MPKTLMFLIIGLFFGFGGGFLVAASTGMKVDAHDHSDPAQHNGATADHADHADMNHAMLTEVQAPLPELSVTLHPDGATSRNLQISVSNFRFSPETVNGVNAPGQGHAHIYVDGIKLARAYGPWFHLSALPKGAHDIRVTLNANDHSQLARKGTPIEATAEVTIE